VDSVVVGSFDANHRLQDNDNHLENDSVLLIAHYVQYVIHLLLEFHFVHDAFAARLSVLEQGQFEVVQKEVMAQVLKFQSNHYCKKGSPPLLLESCYHTIGKKA
jgi:hypothetical protein